MPRISIRSTMPLNWSSRPQGSWMTTGLAARRLRIIETVRSKSAPMRSLLLMHALRGARERVGGEAGAHHRTGAVEVGAEAVHLVDERDARHAVAVGLAPDGLRLRLDAD